MSHPHRHTALYILGLICAITPLVTVHVTWGVATLSGKLSPCVPYWADCHSISATGRYFPANIIFKGIFVPLAVVMAVYWWQLHRWLVRVSCEPRRPLLVPVLGITASIALLIYTLTLGVESGPFPLARRIGAVVYFAFTSFAHLIMLVYLPPTRIRRLGIEDEVRWLLGSCAVLVTGAIVSALLGFTWPGWGEWENAFEWAFAVVMVSLFYWVARIGRKTSLT